MQAVCVCLLLSLFGKTIFRSILTQKPFADVAIVVNLWNYCEDDQQQY